MREMNHIQKTVKDFKFLYYQRQLCKGYFAIPVPVIFAVKSNVSDGYLYVRQHIKVLRIRDFDNEFIRHVSNKSPIGVKNVPVRDIANSISAEISVRGREGTQTWAFTKDDLPRVVNEETFTEILACIPLKERDDPLVGKYTLIADYYERFVEWYRMISGDVSIGHIDNWSSVTPFTGEAMVEIDDKVTETFDEIVVNHYPRNFQYNMFQFDVDFSETAGVSPYFSDMERAERIGHHLANGDTLNPFHRRMSDLIGIGQYTKDPTLLVLTTFPVFEQFYNAYLIEVRKRVSQFDAYVTQKEKKNDFVQIGTKLDWLPTAISMLGFDASSAGDYYKRLKAANELRRKVVHEGRQATHEEAGQLVNTLTSCAILCETSLGQATIFMAGLKKADR
ncbi:MAG: hypothetical protein OEU26_09470 [Candidatus Tectomicrobia bacterium]|nr:hypothetical protein [Candidatus Tectomicrobia bacterium]